METFERVCVEDFTVTDKDRSLTFKRGQTYLTTTEDKGGGTVTVFSEFWVYGAPLKIFAGERVFTE